MAEPLQQTPTSPGDDFGPGTLLAGRFRLGKRLGEGAAGEVFEAEDTELGERLAVKLLRREIAGDAGARERFKREIRLAHRVTHPHVCRIHDLYCHRSEDGEVAFLTMELLTGETLEEHLGRRGRLSPDEVLPLLRQMAAGLAAAHGAGVVHRDFKSANVMLLGGGPGDPATRAVITDFGLATPSGPRRCSSITAHGTLVGSPAYMAPEQLRGEPATPATDVYALGVVMYEMVTGELPFEGTTAFTTAVKRLHEPPPSPRARVPQLPARWEEVILTCLALEPAARYSSPQAALAALDSPCSTPRRRPSYRLGRRSLLLALILTGLVCREGLSPGWGATRSAPPSSAVVPEETSLPGATTDAAERVQSLRELAAGRARGGDLDAACSIYRQALQLARRHELQEEVHAVLHKLGGALLMQGDVAASRTTYEESLVLARRLGDLALAGRSLNALGNLLAREGDYPQAVRAFEEARVLFDRSGYLTGVAAASNNLATLWRRQGRLADAARLLREAHDAYRREGRLAGQAAALSNLAIVLRQTGRLNEARAALGEALRLLPEVGNPAAEARAQLYLADVLMDLGDLPQAERLVAASLATLESLEGDQGLDLALFSAGQLALLTGDLTTARARHQRALEIRHRLEGKLDAAESLLALAEIALAEGRPAEAEVLARSAADDFAALGGRDHRLQADLLRVRALLQRGRDAPAAVAFAEIEAAARGSENPRLRFLTERTAIELTAVRDDRETVRRRLDALSASFRRSEIRWLRQQALELEEPLVRRYLNSPGSTA